MPREARTFRYGRDKRPPEPFTIEYEVDVVEKVELTGDDGTVTYEERPTGETVWESATFHARSGVPAGLVMAVNNVDPSKPEDAMKQTRAVRALLRAGLVEADDFLALLDSERAALPQAVINDVTNLIAEVSGNRPTNTPSR
jgi:hypothetical protein